ncbi:MAG: AMMECR1 domain-containing protein, partial [Candidatus Sungiibacteriota bacterium]
LRGSAVVENRNLGKGIAEAAIIASHDGRFKPLSFGELPYTRIEITVMSDLRLPLSEYERKKNVVYSEKGYLLKSGSAKGWYLPAVFNVRRFRNLEEFLGDLAQEKAGVRRDFHRDADVCMFEVNDFIESSNHQTSLQLAGPIVGTVFELKILNSGPHILDSRLRMAADWLCRIQEPDGNIPPVINPLTGLQTQIDWPRLAFVAWSLAEFGKMINEEKYIQAAEKSADYLRKHLLGNYELRITNYELTLAYFGQLALASGRLPEAALAASKILDRLNSLNFEAIAFSQIASFFKKMSGADRRFLAPFENLAKILKENFDKNLKSRQPMSLAVWAELVNTFRDVEPEFSQKVAEWLMGNQLQNGAFSESTASDFVYTRGTSKIFEVLALEQEKNKEAIEKALDWLFSMQYDEENAFFVPEEIRPKILGAFRHDYFNHETWIDSAGHLLLGATRLRATR